MAFDPTNQADLTALKNEYELDPNGQGYRAPTDYYALGDTSTLTDLVNAPAADGETKNTADFDGFDYAEAISDQTGTALAERAEVLKYDAASSAEISGAANAQTAVAVSSEHAGIRDSALTNIQFFTDFRSTPIPARYQSPLLGQWTGLTAGNQIRQNLINLAQGPKSRAEQLFGDGTVLRVRDTQAALARG